MIRLLVSLVVLLALILGGLLLLERLHCVTITIAMNRNAPATVSPFKGH